MTSTTNESTSFRLSSRAAGTGLGGVLTRLVQLRRAPHVSRRPRVTTVVAAIVFGAVVLAAIAPGLFTRTDPLAIDALQFNEPPSAEHLLGTDYLGRDLLARVIHGARYSLTIGLVATAILLALVVIGITGTGIVNLAITLGIATIPTYARVVRAQTYRVIRSDYVAQARTFGLTPGRLVLRHVLPNALGVVPVVATIELGGAIIGAASLSFLGLGPQPPTPEWGAILADSRDFLMLAPWTGILPGLVLTATVISANILGRAIKRRYERRSA